MNRRIITKKFTILASNSSVKYGESEVTLIYRAMADSILMLAFLGLKKYFKSHKPSYSKANAYRKAFELLQSSDAASHILTKSPSELKSDDLIAAMRAFEFYLISINVANHTRSKSSRVIKTALGKCTLPLIDGRCSFEALRQFKSQFSKTGALRNSKKPLFGDISTIEHVDIKSLEEQALNNISKSLGSIEVACNKSIANYLDTVDRHKVVKNQILEPEIEAFFEHRLTTTSPWSLQYFETLTFTESNLMTFILQCIGNGKITKDSPLPGLSALPITLSDKGLWLNENSYHPYLFAEYYLPNHILVSIAVLICLKTAWNKSSVHSLLISGITKISSSRYELQSMKTKTDDETPVYEVVRSRDPILFKSIELLLWHHSQLREIFKTNEERIFISRNKKKCSVFFPLEATNLNNNFVKIYDVPKFSASDLRSSQAGVTILTTNDIQAVRELLGHKDISTSAEYLENSVFFQLNEARVLEFQRRIDATITFIDGGELLIGSRGLKGQHVDENLIIEEIVGDGSRCNNPYDSPAPNAKKGELCDGLYCHIDGGCKNNVIRVGLDDIELALRTRKYYQARWIQLYEKNPKNFAQLHVPKIIFMHVLLAYTKDAQPNLFKAFNEEGIKC